MARPRKKDDAPPPHADIGSRLEKVRKAWDLDQTRFAEGIGVESNTYSGWESGQKRIGIDSAMELKRVYGATLDYIYTGDHGTLPLDLVIAIRSGSLVKEAR